MNSNQTAVSDTDLELNSPVLVDASTGRFLFIGGIENITQGLAGTDDPGFQSKAGTFADVPLAPGTLIVLGSMLITLYRRHLSIK